MQPRKIAEQVIAAAAQQFGVDVSTLKSRSRAREVAAARGAVYFVLRHVCPQLSMESIAQILHQVDRKSVYNGIKRCELHMQEWPDYRRAVETLLAAFSPCQPAQRSAPAQQRELIALWAHMHHESVFVKSA